MRQTILIVCAAVLVGWGLIQMTGTPTLARDKNKNAQAEKGEKKAKPAKGNKGPKEKGERQRGHKLVMTRQLKAVGRLTDEQKARISEIQAETARKIAELKAQESEQILNILDEEQKGQYKTAGENSDKGKEKNKGKDKGGEEGQDGAGDADE